MEIGPIVRALARNKVRFGLIVVQIAITLAVVANAVNMILVERAKMLRPSAFDEHNILSVISERFAATFNDPNYSIAVVESDLRLLRAIPGVVAVTNTQFIPWEGVGGNRSNTFIFANRDFSSQYYDVTPGFLDVLGMRIVEGRDLRPTDIDDNPNASAGPVLISRDLERYLFGNGSAVGRLLKDHEGGMWTVVGVFDPFYQPFRGFPIEHYCVIRARHTAIYGGPYLVRVKPGAMKSVVQMITPRLLASNDGRNIALKTIDEYKNEFFTSAHVIIGAMTSVIVLIILITGVGIAGVTSFSVTERRRQIGTRRALGATKTAVIRYFLLENWLITNSGIVLGAILAYALNFALLSLIAGTKLDWRYVVAGALLLWAQGIIATLMPAARAAAVPPVIATRTV